MEKEKIFNATKDEIELLAKHAIRESINPTKSKQFSPKLYLDHKINPFNCHHEVYINNNGLHTCLICKSCFYDPSNDKIPNAIEFTKEYEELIEVILKLMMKRYVDKDQIDLLNILKELKPVIDEIINTSIEEKENKLTRAKNVNHL